MLFPSISNITGALVHTSITSKIKFSLSFFYFWPPSSVFEKLSIFLKKPLSSSLKLLDILVRIELDEEIGLDRVFGVFDMVELFIFLEIEFCSVFTGMLGLELICTVELDIMFDNLSLEVELVGRFRLV